MFRTAPGPRVFRQTAGAVGAVALMVLGASPAAAHPEHTLLLDKIAPFEGVKPGSTLSVPATFTNTASETLPKVWVSYQVSYGLSISALPSNCQAWKVGGFDEMPVSTKAVCSFEQSVEAGGVYAPEKDLAVEVLDTALYDTVTVVAATDDLTPSDEASGGPVRGTAPAVKLTERTGATPSGNDVLEVPVKAVNTADFQVTGAQLTGRVGDRVKLTPKFTNAGPAWVYERKVGEPATRVFIKMPAGTTVTKSSGACEKQSAGLYECGTSQAWIDEGYPGAYAFELRIDKAVPGAKGSVALEDAPRPYDPDKANDKADITLDVTGGGTAGGGNSSSGGGSASSGGGSTGGSAASGGSGTDGGSAATAGSATGSTGGDTATGDLASTGSSSALPLAGAAAAAVGIGAGTLLVVRRRRAARG